MMKGQARLSAGIMGLNTHMIFGTVPAPHLGSEPDTRLSTSHHATMPRPWGASRPQRPRTPSGRRPSCSVTWSLPSPTGRPALGRVGELRAGAAGPPAPGGRHGAEDPVSTGLPRHAYETPVFRIRPRRHRVAPGLLAKNRRGHRVLPGLPRAERVQGRLRRQLPRRGTRLRGPRRPRTPAADRGDPGRGPRAPVGCLHKLLDIEGVLA